ncbi:unnamed protein product [marine sediment metagenome]|uniref:Uncharacterized protein n=1 Tax=marine sediment metagenome TaxID=412755 RepID=X1UTT6_9ZZZZ
MLTKKQKSRLDVMVSRYYFAMRRTSSVSNEIIQAWSKRYMIAMKRELMKQGKS